MANATKKVGKAHVRWEDSFIKRSTKTLAAETTFYTHAMIGVTETGYYAKFDDTASMLFAGLVRGQEGDPVLPAGTAGADALQLDLVQPKRFELAISGVAVTDIGKTVYASDDQTGLLTSSALTYANVVGIVVDVVASGIALVEPAYDGVGGNKRLGAARFLAATGAVTISKFDAGKTIFAPSTGAQTATLPAVADVPPGLELHFVKTTADAVALTLDGNSSETIDGATTYAAIDAAYDCATLVSTGAAWIIKNRDIA